MLDVAKQDREFDRSSRRGRNLAADNDDNLPVEICSIIDALARAAAKRDHHAALRENDERD